MVYVLSNQKRNVFFIGITGGFLDCIIDHKMFKTKRISCWQKCTEVVYIRGFRELDDAAKFLERLEKEIQQWNFSRIRGANPGWRDLTEKWFSPTQLLSFQVYKECFYCSEN